MQPLVSIIVPVFNGMPAFKACLHSLQEQTYKNIEFIVVDDGSKDNLLDYLSSVEDPRLSVVSQANLGVSAARNVGLESSSGVYTAFVDADDVVMPNFIQEAVVAMQDHDLDMVVGAIKQYKNENELIGASGSPLEVKVYRGAEVAKVVKKTIAYEVREDPFLTGYSMSSCWCKLYKSSLIKGVKFKSELAIGEDALFNVQYLQSCKSVGFVANQWYEYSIQDNSALGRFRPDSFEQAALLVSAVKETAGDSNMMGPYISIRALHEFERACLASGAHKESGMSIWDFRSIVDKELNVEPWQALFDPKDGWIYEVQDARYSLFARLCSCKCSFLICVYLSVVRKAREVKNG